MSGYFDLLFAKLDFWAMVGLVGQLIFTTRFLVQWLVSERRKESTIPVSFWWISIVGSVFVLAYGIQHAELPVILGQLLGFGVYIRNLTLIYGKRAATRKSVGEADFVSHLIEDAGEPKP